MPVYANSRTEFYYFIIYINSINYCLLKLYELLNQLLILANLFLYFHPCLAKWISRAAAAKKRIGDSIPPYPVLMVPDFENENKWT